MLCRVKTKEGTLRLVGLNLLITPHPTKVELTPEQAQMLMDDYGVEVEPVEETETVLGEALEAEQVVGMPEAVEPSESEVGGAEPESVEPPEAEEEKDEEDEPEGTEEAPKPKRKRTKGGD